MKSVHHFFVGLLSSAVLFFFFPSSVFAAPRLYLDPATATVSAGLTTSLDLTIDTSGQSVTAADAKITFPKALLESSTITTGAFFDSISKVVNAAAGTVEIHGYFSSASSTQSQTGTGIIATLTFKGLAPGRATLAIPCAAGSTTDANIADATGKDLIDCAGTAGSEITIAQATGGSSLTPTPTPSSLPVAGVETPTIVLFAAGMMIFAAGFFLIRREAYE